EAMKRQELQVIRSRQRGDTRAHLNSIEPWLIISYYMANLALRLPENVPGDFFVDSTCIDCDACRQIAPGTFVDDGDTSVVYRQPADAEETKRALMALVACPPASIGTTNHRTTPIGLTTTPQLISQTVIFSAL